MAGRPIELTDEVWRGIIAAIQCGNDFVVAAGAQGVPESTFSRWLARGADDAPCRKLDTADRAVWSACETVDHPVGECPGNARFREFRVAVYRGRHEFEVTMSAYVARSAPRDVDDARWLLERRAPARWKHIQAVEQSATAEAPPFEIRFVRSVRPGDEMVRLSGGTAAPVAPVDIAPVEVLTPVPE